MKGLHATLTAWQRPRPPVGTTPSDVVHRENKLSLLRYRPRPEGVKYARPVLLVPSLINRHYVLDLLPGKSFAEYLVAQGHDVYCIDWGTPSDEDRFVTFDDVTDRYLGRVVRRVAAMSQSDDVHVLGYCLGGTLAAIHAAARPELVASLTLLAAPVKFHDDGLLSTWVRSPTFDLPAMIAAFGNVPWQLMQGAFQLLRPTMPLAKAVTMLDRAWNDEFLDGFLALETWGNDNVSFPGACYERYVTDLYRADALAKGELRLSGRAARLDAVKCPVLAVTFEHDEIVPWASAAAVMDLVGSVDKHHMHLPGGHVGAVVSKSAARGLWPALAKFWADRDGLRRHGWQRRRRAHVRPPGVVGARRRRDLASVVVASLPRPLPTAGTCRQKPASFPARANFARARTLPTVPRASRVPKAAPPGRAGPQQPAFHRQNPGNITSPGWRAAPPPVAARHSAWRGRRLKKQAPDRRWGGGNRPRALVPFPDAGPMPTHRDLYSSTCKAPAGPAFHF